MDDVNQLLDNIGPETATKTTGTTAPVITAIDFSWMLKLPGIVILLVNVFFAVLLFLRARILADTIATSQSKLVKSIIILYVAFTVIGTLLSILFLILA